LEGPSVSRAADIKVDSHFISGGITKLMTNNRSFKGQPRQRGKKTTLLCWKSWRKKAGDLNVRKEVCNQGGECRGFNSELGRKPYGPCHKRNGRTRKEGSCKFWTAQESGVKVLT